MSCGAGLEGIKQDDPLRLEIAATIAFPDGTMTASGLRKEAAKGRLVIERIAGKDYVSLAAIARMRELCRQNPKDRTSGSAKPDATSGAELATSPSGSSSTALIKGAQSAAEMIVRELKERSPNTSSASTSKRRKKASVIPLKYRSRMS